MLIDKPTGITSFGIVARLRRLSGIAKIGHAGTLDPHASGLMIMLIGKDFTRQADQYLKLDKEYDVGLTLGKVSESGDAEGPISDYSNKAPTQAEVKKVLKSFMGTITQTPPRHSAIKIDGQRAYKLVRRNEQFSVPPRQVHIYAITNEHYNYPTITFSVRVGSGTYIRSLGEDIGKSLGTGAYVSMLRRTSIGEYKLADSTTLEKLGEIW